MNRILRILLSMLLSFQLISCSSLSPAIVKKRDSEYLSARSIPPLKMPPGSSSSAFQDQYPVSAQSYPKNLEQVSLIPPGL
ncbi:MAG: hypothetical protein A3F12_06755 [Gammaproteobacteria bacterium RIFCSPHIGHO2_12_FULL_38_14]|nr:MAG: hypothetical protein A3F12_06755 [Gammaproteobacteria bacterium RIFCSPHIGHO2_12_FULL_38_14]